jgi:hypothetical protein
MSGLYHWHTVHNSHFKIAELEGGKFDPIISFADAFSAVLVTERKFLVYVTVHWGGNFILNDESDKVAVPSEQ